MVAGEVAGVAARDAAGGVGEAVPDRGAGAVGEGLAASGILNATPGELRALATNVTVVATFWLSFEHARRPRGAPDIGRGVYQVMSLAAPFMEGKERALLEKLSIEYVSEH